MKKFVPILICIVLIVFSGCSKDNTEDLNIDYEYLNGTWIDKESFAMQFIDFYSDNQARFGLYSKNLEHYDTFNYRIIESTQIAIDLIRDNESEETFHDLKRIDDNTFEISDLTVIPENPDKIYLKRDIITGKKNDTIIIGYNQIYFDFENHFRLQIDSVLNDSRCPNGAICDWEGNASVQFDLIVGGNYQYNFSLNTYRNYTTDTTINHINFSLVGLCPYPEINKKIENEDYLVKILIEIQ